MQKKSRVQKPLVEDILDQMFAELEGREEFDPITISNLKKLGSQGNLKKASKVQEVVTPKGEGAE